MINIDDRDLFFKFLSVNSSLERQENQQAETTQGQERAFEKERFSSTTLLIVKHLNYCSPVIYSVKTFSLLEHLQYSAVIQKQPHVVDTALSLQNI